MLLFLVFIEIILFRLLFLRVKEEELMMEKPFGKEYEVDRKRINRLFPKF